MFPVAALFLPAPGLLCCCAAVSTIPLTVAAEDEGFVAADTFLPLPSLLPGELLSQHG